MINPKYKEKSLKKYKSVPKDVPKSHIDDSVGSRQDLLAMLLGVGLDTTDLCHMGSPFHLGIVHLQEQSVRKIQPSFGHSPHPGFKFQYPGEEPERDGNPMPDRLGCLV